MNFLMRWIRKEAKPKNAIAQYNLGSRYYHGQGITQDYQKAVQWFRKAAEQGYVNAQYDLGICYESGDGVAQDFQQAAYWYRKAAEQGDVKAQDALRSLSSKTPTPPQSQSTPSSPSVSQKAPTPPPKAQESPASSNIYGYISSMPKDTLIQSIRDEYYHIKGTFDTAPAMGEFGSFEFAGVLLIWKYLRENLRTNFREIGEFMIPLGAHIGCAYNCMTALEWSDTLESIIKAHDLLPYDEFSQIYRYLKENFSNEIHAMEFCGETVVPLERISRYRAFVREYNAFPDYSFTLSYFERQGLRIKQDMPFRIDC